MTGQKEDATLTIGQSGRLSQLSRKALRLNEDRGLLVPARTDPSSGYRYYSLAQVGTARRIQLRRMLTMPLESIARVLALWEEDPRTAQRLIRQHVSAVEK